MSGEETKTKKDETKKKTFFCKEKLETPGVGLSLVGRAMAFTGYVTSALIGAVILQGLTGGSLLLIAVILVIVGLLIKLSGRFLQHYSVSSDNKFKIMANIIG